MTAKASWKERLTERGMGRIFRYPDFVLFSFTGWFANIGTWLQRVGIQWLAWELTHSYAWLGAMALADAIGIIFFLPLFGTVIDRGNRLDFAKLSQWLATALTLLLAILTLMDWINIWLLLAMMFLHGVTEAFWTPVRMALPPSMVPRADLAPALGLTAILFNLAQIIGPAAAGLIILAFDNHRVGIGFLFVGNAVLALVYLWSFYIIKLLYEDYSARHTTGFFSDFKDGILYAYHKEGLALFMLMMVATTLIMRAFRELLAGYADGVFHQGPQGLAVLTSAVGIGALVGAVIIANFGNVKGLTRTIFVYFGIGIALQFGFALTGNFTIAAACTIGMGLAVAIGGIGSQLLVQSAIHGAMRGRVMSLWALILRGGPPLGAWIIGVASEAWDFQLVMVVATALYALIFLAILPRMKYIAVHLETQPDETELPRTARKTAE